MTACAIEGETAGAAATVSPVSGEAGKAGKAEGSGGREEPEEPERPEAARGPEGAWGPDEPAESHGVVEPPVPDESGEPGGGVGAAPRAAAFTIAADGSYAARLTLSGAADAAAWFPERWTLDGHEPYAVPLPLDQPEEPDSDVLPLADGRVLIRRQVADRHTFSLLYPTGPGTGELPLGALGRADGVHLTLLPPRRTVRVRTPFRSGNIPPPSGWWRAGRSDRFMSRMCRGGAPAGSGWTGRGGCWLWTGSPWAAVR